jgi:TRAP-type C4-dicarboxylate transport system permease small subunit
MREQRGVLRILNRLEEIIIAALIATATLVVLAAIIQRYGLSHTVALMGWAKAQGYDALAGLCRSLIYAIIAVRLTWAQELTIILLIWMAKIGAAYGVRTGIHVGVDILVNRLDGAWRSGLILFGLLAGAFFTGTVGVLSTRFVTHLVHTGHSSAVLEAPMWLVYLAVPVGSFLMSFRFLEAAWNFHQTGALPTHDPGQLLGLQPPLHEVLKTSDDEPKGERKRPGPGADGGAG